MKEETIQIQDGSNDKNYFTLIPNYILNHSTGTAQALYLQLKRFAGDKGEAFPSQKTLMEKLGISKPTLRKELKYLLEKGWIIECGEKRVNTKGGIQKVKIYRIVDIWRLNSEFYSKEGKNNTPLETKEGKNNTEEGGKNRPPNNIPLKEDPKESATIVAVPKIDSFFGKAKKSDGIPFSCSQFILMCRGSANRHIRLIGEYADAREDELDFDTCGQWREFGNRNLRVAKELSPFSDAKIQQALNAVAADLKTEKNKQGFITTWGMETLKKYLIK